MKRRGFFWLLMLLLFTSGILLSGSEQSDRISFFGNIIGAAGSIVGVYWTLRDNRKQLEDQHRKEIFPFITFSNFIGSIEKEGKFNSEFQDAENASGEQLELHKVYEVKFDDNLDADKHFYLVFDVKNVGLGTGMITKMEVSDKATKQTKYTSKRVSDYSDKNTVLMLANVGEINKLMLRLDKDFIFKPGIILIKCYYEDLVFNSYYFEKEIEIRQTAHSDLFSSKGLKNKKPIQVKTENPDCD